MKEGLMKSDSRPKDSVQMGETEYEGATCHVGGAVLDDVGVSCL